MASVSRKRKTAASLPSSAEPSSAAARPWKHDVFLSFGGRKSFTSELFRGLIKRRITTFKKNKVYIYPFSSPSTLEAIEGSRFAIVVLSKNCASSARFLEELANIFQLMDDVDFRILPVCYGVRPADVRKMNFRIANIWEKTGRYTPDQMKRWRDALAKVHRLSGWDSRDYKTDKNLVEAVVESVWNRVKHVKTNTGSFEVFEATRKAMDEVTKALNNDKVTVVEIYGVGGVGKTTMVKHVCAEVLSKGCSIM